MTAHGCKLRQVSLDGLLAAEHCAQYEFERIEAAFNIPVSGILWHHDVYGFCKFRGRR